MNILPKKRWHVLKKENIARVRADEAKFNEEQKKIEIKAQLADQEARVDYLRKQRKIKSSSASGLDGFQLALDKDNVLNVSQGNIDYEKEKKEEQEKKEKAIGLLTYLGQTVLDAAGEKPWYDIHPRDHQRRESERKKDNEEMEIKKKILADPLTEMKKVENMFKHHKEMKKQQEASELQRANACIHAMPSLFPDDIIVPKHQNQKIAAQKKVENGDRSKLTESILTLSEHTSKTSPAEVLKFDDKIEKSNVIEMAKSSEINRLRAQRLQRERKERDRAAVLLAKSMGLTDILRHPIEEQVCVDERKLPFNSAFNPELSAVLSERRRRHRESRKRHYDEQD
uniref:Cir_N domain-containing protein n=1 Tax=Trichobilharzia regenti TaxID=157069 RepID=A0AA85JGT9_TRIRE|nr:unnamed protein product [Trichobilharzia regenti]